MYATRILWRQMILAVLPIVLATTWATTQQVAWKLGYQPQSGKPWFEVVPGLPIYFPVAFFWWWYAYDAYAPEVFVERAYIAASDGFLSIAVAVTMPGPLGQERRNARLAPLGWSLGESRRRSDRARRRGARRARSRPSAT